MEKESFVQCFRLSVFDLQAFLFLKKYWTGKNREVDSLQRMVPPNVVNLNESFVENQVSATLETLVCFYQCNIINKLANMNISMMSFSSNDGLLFSIIKRPPLLPKKYTKAIY